MLTHRINEHITLDLLIHGGEPFDRFGPNGWFPFVTRQRMKGPKSHGVHHHAHGALFNAA